MASRRNVPTDPVHASWLRVIRCARGYTGSQLAWRCDVTPAMISALELEEKTPSEALGQRIADVLGVKTESLFPGLDCASPFEFLVSAEEAGELGG